MNKPKFSEMLKHQRLASGYNQSEVSSLLYMSRSTYNRYESGERIPPVEFIIRVAALYNIHPIDLMRTLIPDDIWDNNPDYSDFLSRGKYALTSNELKLVDSFKNLSDDEQHFVMNIVNKFSDM